MMPPSPVMLRHWRRYRVYHETRIARWFARAGWSSATRLANAAVSALSPGTCKEERIVLIPFSRQAFDGVIQHEDKTRAARAIPV
jgi:hypothetical protein